MKQFFGTCVENPFDSLEELEKVIDEATEITMETFFRVCEVTEELESQIREYPHDYEFYRFKDIYFYTWSCIEHFYR